MEACRTLQSAFDPLILQESDPEKAREVLTEFFLKGDFPGKLMALEAVYWVFVDSWVKECCADPAPLQPDELDANGRYADEPEP